ncbi:hypothetical protein X777_12627 [Ooceraea biroi]|uniref:Uncharacterized protein n=1 Tax=Ooceraea biroi TaxID=2015173 RepID=A0A026W0R1_OOCBI|nr:hypothetical protein X777_12627 [Ooceraea biroi]
MPEFVERKSLGGAWNRRTLHFRRPTPARFHPEEEFHCGEHNEENGRFLNVAASICNKMMIGTDN